MELISIDKELCKKDKICMAECPAQIIGADEDGFPALIKGAEELCINCGHCVAVCPEAALNHRIMKAADCKPIDDDLTIGSEAAEQFLASRRSLRLFKKKPVEKEALEKLIRISDYGASGHNTRVNEWIVITDPEKTRALAKMIYDWMGWMLENMPDLAKSMHMDRARADWERGKDRLLRSAPQLIIGISGEKERTGPATVTTALTYMELAAPAYGLGTCWAGYFTAACQGFKPILKAIGLPEGKKVYGALMVGYPKISYHRIPVRKKAPITWA